MNNLLVLQSGGPTAVINASLVGIIREATRNENIDKIYGAVKGIEGMMNNDLVDLSALTEDDLALLRVTPSAYLGSTKLHLADDYLDSDFNIIEDYQNIYRTIKEKEIAYVVLIGGNNSMDTVSKLDKFFKGVNLSTHIIAVPKTIDNDMLFCDHTPGYGSALKYVANQIAEIRLDTESYDDRVSIVEIKGRDSGWLAAGSKLASLNGLGPDLIYLPELTFSMAKFLDDVKEVYSKKHRALVVVADGLKNELGRFVISSYSFNQAYDAMGFISISGVGTVLAQIVKETLGIPARSIELQLIQRCSAHLVSKVDFDEAYDSGKFAVNKVLEDTGKVVTLERGKSNEYEIHYGLVDVKEVADKVKTFPLDWIVNGNDVSSEFIDYAKELIAGQVQHVYENNLPKFLIRKK